MPSIHGFRDRRTAEKLAAIARRDRPAAALPSEATNLAVDYFLRVPESGVPGFVNNDTDTTVDLDAEADVVMCELYAVSVDAEAMKAKRRPVLGPDGEIQAIGVCNLHNGAIPPFTWIAAGRITGGALLVQYAPCPDE